jgi:hypothetical protein
MTKNWYICNFRYCDKRFYCEMPLEQYASCFFIVFICCMYCSCMIFVLCVSQVICRIYVGCQS